MAAVGHAAAWCASSGGGAARGRRVRIPAAVARAAAPAPAPARGPRAAGAGAAGADGLAHQRQRLERALRHGQRVRAARGPRPAPQRRSGNGSARAWPVGAASLS